MRQHRLLRYVARKETAAVGKSSDNAITVMKQWLDDLLSACETLNLDLACYVVSSSKADDLATLPPAKECDLFPCPPPYAWHCDEVRSVARRRRRAQRFKERRVCELWTNLMVVTLSRHASGLAVAPRRGRVGVPLSGAQKGMRDLCWKFVKSIVRLARDDAGCGLRLPAAGTRLSDAREQFDDLFNLPYACQNRAMQKARSEDGFSATQALPVIAERLSLPEKVSDFDPRPFLSDLFREVYEDPSQFLKPQEEMPPAIRARGTATRKELLKVFSRWDHLGRLFVCDAAEVSKEDRCEIFAVAKDRDRDRQILHRRKRNRREIHFDGASKRTSPRCAFNPASLGGPVCLCLLG